MTVFDRLNRLSSAEEFFEVLDVAYDPAILNVARLHILRRMGEYLRQSAVTGADDAAAREFYAAQLRRAYSDFVDSSPLNERVFKVLKDAIHPPAAPLVQLLRLAQAEPEATGRVFKRNPIPGSVMRRSRYGVPM